MARIFCPRCHKLAAQVIRNDGRVKISQGGKVLVSFEGGSEGNKISVNCPNGHPVEVKV